MLQASFARAARTLLMLCALYAAPGVAQQPGTAPPTEPAPTGSTPAAPAAPEGSAQPATPPSSATEAAPAAAPSSADATGTDAAPAAVDVAASTHAPQPGAAADANANLDSAAAPVAEDASTQAAPAKTAVTMDSDDDGSGDGLDDAITYPHFVFSARVMTGFEVDNRHVEGGQSLNGDNKLSYEFFLQQARVGVDAYPHKRIKLTLSFDLEEPGIRNAYANVRMKRWAQLRIGRFKRPFSRIELRSIGKLPFRKRGIFNKELIEDSNWGDRALGAMFWGEFKKVGLRYQLAVMHPLNQPTQISFKQGADVMGRVEYRPIKLISFGVNGAHKVIDDEQSPAVHMNAVGGDIRLRTELLEVVAEFDAAQNANPPPAAARTETDPPFALGAMGYVAYEIPFTKKWSLQPVVVGEWVDTDRDFSEDETFRTVFGLNVLWKDIVRLMPQVELVQPLGTVSTRSRVARETYYLLVSVAVN